MKKTYVMFLTIVASLGILLVLFSALADDSSPSMAAPRPDYTFDELRAGNLLPLYQGEISCTLDITTTDSLNNSNTSLPDAESLSDYDNLALVSTPSYPGDEEPTHEDWFRLDNAEIGATYQVEALPDRTTNYNLGIVVYDLDRTPIITNANAVDNNQAKVTLEAENQGPYYFMVYQISSQCSGGTYDLETSFTGPPATSTPGPNEDNYEQNDNFSQAYELPLGTSISLEDLAGKASFYPEGDDDWFKFWSKSGHWYQAATSDLSGVDTYLEIRNRDNSVIESDDDGGGGYDSQAEWEAQYDGYYYIRIVNNTKSTGEYNMTVKEIATPTPGPTDTPAPGPTPRGQADECEDNSEFDRACVLPVNVSKTFNFVPPYKGTDNDFYKIWVKPNLHFKCATSDLDPGIDPNMIVFNGPSWDNAIGGNDDIEPGNYNCAFSYFATYEGWLYILVGTGDRTPADMKNSDYTLICEMWAPGQATSTPGPTKTPQPDKDEPTFTPTPREEESTPTPTTPSSPVATPTEPRNLSIRPLTTPTPVPEDTPSAPRFIPIKLLIYYDDNGDGQAGAGEGISGISAHAYEVATNQLLAQGFTDEQGNLEFTVAAQGPVRVSVPFLGFSQLVTGEGGSIYLRVPPQSVPGGTS